MGFGDVLTDESEEAEEGVLSGFILPRKGSVGLGDCRLKGCAC